MVAAAVIGSSVIGAGSNLIGGLTSSSAASSSAAAQQRQLNQVLQYQQSLLSGALPIAQQLQQQGTGQVGQSVQDAISAISGYGSDAINALYGGAQNAYDALTTYAPQAVNAITDWTNSALSPLIATSAAVPGEIRGGVNRALDLLSGAGTNITNLLQPYATAGSNAIGELWNEINGTSPVPGQAGALGAVPNITDPSQLPGYQFALQQGENAAKNQGSASGYAGVGGNLSGPLGKSLATFAEGLANSNYTQYLQNYWANQNNRYGILAGLAGTGGQIGSNLGQILAGLGTAGASTALSGSVDMSQILASLAGNIGNIASSAGANIGNIWSNLGTGVANLESTLGSNAASTFSGIGSNIGTTTINALSPYVQALVQPWQSVAQLAGATSGNVGTAGVTGAANVGNATQSAGNLLGGSIQGTGGLLGNALLTNALLNPSNTGTINSGQTNVLGQSQFYQPNSLYSNYATPGYYSGFGGSTIGGQ